MLVKEKILVVDDDKHISELICLYLNKDGYETKEIDDGNMVLDTLRNGDFKAVILDVMLPGTDGFNLLSKIRSFSEIPVIMLTARGENFDKILGLEMGADDYIVKPFDPKEMVARLHAVLRRYEKKSDEKAKTVRYDNLEVNISNYSVTYHGKTLDFPPKELELLYFLASNPNRVYTRDELLDKVWGYDRAVDSRTVDVHVKRIREKFTEEENWKIKTVRSVGYSFSV
ncbi:MAG: response regulator transcription factor [Firmicutes bacterium]|nr:response regulator transcription factor [Bacillota bacterium]